MPSSSPRRRPVAVGLALATLVAGMLAGALPAAAQDVAVQDGGAPFRSLRAALTNGEADLELPRGTTRRAPLGMAALRADAPTPEPAPGRAQLTAAKVSTINITFVDTSGNSWSPQAKAAFRAAADVWERTVESRVPISVEATARSLGPGLLGGAGPFDFLRNEGTTVVPESRNPVAADLRDDVFEPVALFNARTGRDAIPPAGGELNPDIVAEFNPNLGGLYLGTDGRPSRDQLDFRTIVLHEIGHGLGIAGTAAVNGSTARVGSTEINGDTGVRSAVSFDQFTYATTAAQAGNGGTRVLSMADGSPALRGALTGGSLYWAGQQAITASRGAKVRLYAPSQCGAPGPERACAAGESPFLEGTSYSHLSEAVYDTGTPNGLMTPFLDNGESYQDVGQIAMGVLADMGWSVPALSGTRFTAVDPVRVLDTREGLGAPRTTVPAGGVVDVQVAGTRGVPADATAVVLNVTGVAPSSATDVRVYPTPVTLSTPPEVSNINLVRGITRANLVTVPVGNGGRVRVRNQSGRVHLLADLAGFYAPSAASTFTPVDPSRVLDTREAIGTPSRSRVPAGGQVDLQVAGRGGVPVGASAVAMTVTAVNASAPSDVRLYPASSNAAAVPVVSNINVRVGPGVPNVVIVKLDPDGRVRLRNSAGEVHLLADVAGYYDAAESGSLFRPVTPRRVLDTRSRLGTGPNAPTKVGAGQAITLTVGGVAQVPRTATAAVLNVTGVFASQSTDVRVYPATSTDVPVVSNLNLARAQTAADLVVVKLGAGQVKLRNASGTVALVADAAGWFGPAS